MKQVIKFKSDEEHYKADACVIWCFDDRFTGLLGELNQFGFKHVDLIKVAGGAKDLADGAKSLADLADEVGVGCGVDGARYLEDQILKSIKLHNTPLVILMIHKECGAYGDLSSVVNLDEFLIDQLKRAKKNLGLLLALENFDLVGIKTYLADFNGLWEVE